LTDTQAIREQVYTRLVQDLEGPLEELEVFRDRPSQRYSTGILYPLGTTLPPEENEDGGLAANVQEDASSETDESGVALHAALKPSVAGLSFALRPNSSGKAEIVVEVTCARYEPHDLEKTEAGAEGREQHEWHRVPLKTSIPLILDTGESRENLSDYGIPGLELYALATRISGLLTVTVALSNMLRRGDSRFYDEQQHFFQVCISVSVLPGTEFFPRPSFKALTDEDSRVSALIYRDVVEYVVGHTCSARSVFADNSRPSALRTDWIPRITVPAVSDRGDNRFDVLRATGGRKPLNAAWLAAAPSDQLVSALEELVAAYQSWINDEVATIPSLPPELRAQAALNMERCQNGANRMAEGVKVIADEAPVRRAFQLAQLAMNRQFGWTRGGEELTWRPFQLGFQLLVVPSLADRQHSDRNLMDLLWFPTGGGKTEAYLALTAFVIFLRRIRDETGHSGAGVAVLMRYTLRLLTIQQFQRAAAMICACESLRLEAKPDASLGEDPIGIGLWVGVAATPLNLKDAVGRRPDDPSTPEQLQNCPCCGGKLKWTITPQRSRIECEAESGCGLANRPLPIWTIDEEIYREAPALVIGTVDKFAQIVRNMQTRVLFGRAINADPPDLIIQDELHLISGPLGSMAGLYEAAIDELCRRGSTKAKIVGSTATIRRAQEQIRALFDRDTYQFPAPGLDASNSGFAVVDTTAPGRFYVGLSTVGRSATYMLQALAAALLQSASQFTPGSQERDYYWTLVTYFNSLKELGRGLVLMQDDVPISIRQFSVRRREEARSVSAPAELTSRVPAYEIRDMLERLKRREGESGVVDLLLASNMISVGMDIPRLGLMVVNAQPKTLSEYIQATSRVGRGVVPGIIVTMYNSMRARDRAHYETFETWHRSLYRDVEATSVTPFASRAQDKALHAVLVALVRHTVAGMSDRPILDDIRRLSAEQISSLIEERVARVDPDEHALAARKLKRLLDDWSDRTDLEAYWDDYGKRRSLLMSAEQYAARADVDEDVDPEGARRAMWPTPNSMREVEAGSPYILRSVLRSEDSSNA
jgi:helicase-like protein